MPKEQQLKAYKGSGDRVQYPPPSGYRNLSYHSVDSNSDQDEKCEFIAREESIWSNEDETV